MDLPHRLYTGDVQRLYRDLLALEVATGGIDFGAVQALVAGGANVDGVAETAARSDHVHAWPTHHATHESGGGDAIKLDDLAAPDDNTDLNVSTSKHGLTPKLPNDASKFLNGVGAFETPGIGGIQTWYPDAPPASAHSCDDEMDGGSVDAKWTEWDVSGSVTWDVDTTKHMVRAVQTGNGAVRISGLRQAIPASEFVAYTKVHSLSRQGVNGLGAGLFVADDIATNPSTADFRALELVHAGGTPFRYVLARTWSAYNGTTSSVSSSVPMGGYLRVRVNGTSMEADVSAYGVDWYQVSSVTLGFTPSYFGLYFLNVDNTIEATALWSFFRVQSGSGTSGYNATHIGRFV